MKLNDGIGTTTTVLTKVAEDLGTDIKTVTGVYNSLVDYLKYLNNYTRVTSIRIPHIGILHMRIVYTAEKLKKLKVSKKPSKTTLQRIGFLEQKMEDLKAHLDGLGASGYVNDSRHMRRFKLDQYFFTRGWTHEEIAKKQNEEKR